MACHPACKVPVLQQAILPFLPSCTERSSSTVEQPSQQDGQGTPSTRGVPPCVPWKTQLPSAWPCCCSPSAPREAPVRPPLPSSRWPSHLPCLSSNKLQGAVTQGAAPFPPRGADQATSHMRGLCPGARCPDAAPGFLDQPPQRLFLVLYLTGGVCNQINLLGGALHQAVHPAGQDQKTLALPPGTRQGGGWPQQETPKIQAPQPLPTMAGNKRGREARANSVFGLRVCHEENESLTPCSPHRAL